jgi:hypothetical protein
METNKDDFSTIFISLSIVFCFLGWIIYLNNIYRRNVDGSTWGWISSALTDVGIIIVQYRTGQILISFVYAATVVMSLIAAFYSTGWKTKQLKDLFKIIPSVIFIS